MTRKELREHAKTAWKRLRGGELTPARAAASVALGLAIGVTPLWGVHWLLVLAVCVPLRLDAGVAFLASNVSLPFLAPFITFAEIEVGARALHGAWAALTVDDVKTMRLSEVLAELALGTGIVAAGSAAVGGGAAFGLVAWRRR